MRSHGWPYPVPDRPWAEICDFLDGLAAQHPGVQHMADVANSVVAARAE